MRDRRRVHLLAVLAVAACTTSCSPVIRVFTRIELPPGIKPVLSALTLDVAAMDNATDPPFYVRREPFEGKVDRFEGKIDKDAYEVVVPVHGHHKFVYMRVLHDSNGSGARDPGDYEGDLAPAPFEAFDRGLFRGNDNRTPAIATRVVK